MTGNRFPWNFENIGGGGRERKKGSHQEKLKTKSWGDGVINVLRREKILGEKSVEMTENWFSWKYEKNWWRKQRDIGRKPQKKLMFMNLREGMKVRFEIRKDLGEKSVEMIGNWFS